MKKMRNESQPLKVQARMFSRERITLSRGVCLHTGVRTGNELEFETEGDSFLIRPTKPHGSRENSAIRSGQ
jgi:hypothetical protein